MSFKLPNALLNPFMNAPLMGRDSNTLIAPGEPQFVITDDGLYVTTDDDLFVTTD
jgi:hypothetical protein